jgi:hypothetical protein
MEEAWSVPDVYLLTDGAQGELAVPHLALNFLDSGLALDRADGEPVWDSPWSQLHERSPVERSVLPDGRDGVVMVVVERRRRRRHLFVLATDNTACARDRPARRCHARSRLSWWRPRSPRSFSPPDTSSTSERGRSGE